MLLADKIAEQVPRLPPPLKALLDAELAAGSEIIDVEKGIGADAGKVAIILKYPFRTTAAGKPKDLVYTEMLNRDPQIWEYTIEGGLFSIATAKFKPMKFTPIVGPPDPTEAHIKRIAEIQKRDEKRAKERAEAIKKLPASFPVSEMTDEVFNASGPLARFFASMNITYEKWHDGEGYDLDALAELNDADRKIAEKVLIAHSPRDWRDIEALGNIDSPTARKAVVEALKSTDAQVRRTAMDFAADEMDPRQREQLLIKSLRSNNLFGGLSQAIDEAEEFHPPAVVDELLKGALKRDGEAAVHFAALLFYIHGKAKEPFDWGQRPFFLRFNTTDDKERKVVFKEMCQIIGVDSAKYIRGG